MKALKPTEDGEHVVIVSFLREDAGEMSPKENADLVLSDVSWSGDSSPDDSSSGDSLSDDSSSDYLTEDDDATDDASQIAEGEVDTDKESKVEIGGELFHERLTTMHQLEPLSSKLKKKDNARKSSDHVVFQDGLRIREATTLLMTLTETTTVVIEMEFESEWSRRDPTTEWSRLSESQWKDFCYALSTLPKLTVLETNSKSHQTLIEDWLFDHLFQQLPGLLSLRICTRKEYPRAFERLSSLSSLEHFVLERNDRHFRSSSWQWECWDTLARSLQTMRQLKTVLLRGALFTRVSWNPAPEDPIRTPFLRALGQISTLEQFQFDKCYEGFSEGGWMYDYDLSACLGPCSGCGLFELSRAEMKSLDFYPRLNLVGLQSLLGNRSSVSFSELLDDVVKVNDRLDCLYHLLRIVVQPEVWAAEKLREHTVTGSSASVA